MRNTRSPTVVLWLSVFAMLILSGCAANIAGAVRLVDMNSQPVESGNVEGIVVNMINTSAPLEEASYSVKTGKDGKFTTEGSKLKEGTYKVEAGKSGYLTTTATVEVGGGTKEVLLELKQIPKKQSRTYRSSSSDEDKIVNPGEVNIQPPTM